MGLGCPSLEVIIQSISRLWLLCSPHNISKGIFWANPSNVGTSEEPPKLTDLSTISLRMVTILLNAAIESEPRFNWGWYGPAIRLSSVKKGRRGSTYLGFSDIEQFGHVRAFAGAEVLLQLELFLQLKDLSSGECGARLLLPLRLSPRQWSLVTRVLHIDPILVWCTSNGSYRRTVVVTTAVFVVLLVDRLFALPQRHSGWRSRSGSAAAVCNWLCNEETTTTILIVDFNSPFQAGTN